MRRRRGAAEQAREVDGWGSSGQSAAEYASRRGYSVASLHRWSTVVRRKAGPGKAGTPRFVRLEVAATRVSALVVEVGAARILVERGFDAEHLRAVVAALAGGGSR